MVGWKCLGVSTRIIPKRFDISSFRIASVSASQLEAYPSAIPSESKEDPNELVERTYISALWSMAMDAIWCYPSPSGCPAEISGRFLPIVFESYWFDIMEVAENCVLSWKNSYFVLSWQNLTNHSTIWLAQISTTDPNTVDFHCLAFYFEVLWKQHSLFQFCQWNDPHWLHCWQFKLTRIHWRFGSFEEIVLKGSTISGTWLVNCDGPLYNLPFLRLVPSTSTMWSNLIWPSMVPNILGCTGSRSNGSKPPATAVGKLWRW